MKLNVEKSNDAVWKVFACFIVALFALLSLWLWLPSNFVKPGAAGAGEAFEAYHAAMNVHMFGWRWAGLQDMATNPVIPSHPFLYIHHGNLGLYVSYVLGLIGVMSLESQNFASLAASVVGLLIFFYAILLRTGNGVIAALGLVFLSLSWTYMDIWSFNVHRAFSYCSVMGAIYTYWRCERGDFRYALWFAVFVLACLTLLLADYMFYFFTLIFLVLDRLANVPRTGWKSALRGMILLGIGFAAVFSLRQIQVVAGAGIEIWKHDFLYQVLNRIHMESLFQGNWSKDTTDFYAANSILNPGFAPPASWNLRLSGFLEGTGQVFLTYILGLRSKVQSIDMPMGIGFMFALLSVIVLDAFARWPKFRHLKGTLIAVSSFWSILLILSLAVVAIVNWCATSWLIGFVLVASCASLLFVILRRPQQLRLGTRGDENFVRFGALFLIACLCMYALFPRYFLQWYPEFLLAPLCVAIWTVVLIAPIAGKSIARRSTTLALFVALLSLKAISFAPALLEGIADQGQHAAVLRGIAGQPTASNFTPASVSSYTNAFSGWLKADAVEKLLTTGRVVPDDYVMLFEVDRSNPLYTKPQYFIFFKEYEVGDQLKQIRALKAPAIENSTLAVFKTSID